MNDIPVSREQVLLAVLVFVAVLLLLEALRLVWASRRSRQAQRLEARLARLRAESGAAQARVLRSRLAPQTTGALSAQALQRLDPLQRLIDQAGLSVRASRLLAGSGLAAFAVGGVLLVLGGSGAIAGVMGLSAGAAPWIGIAARRRQRLDRIARQLPEVLDFIVRSLRSGQAFTSALQMCGQEIAEPVGSELRMAHEEISFGASLAQALTHLGERVPLIDLRYLIVAVLIQRESGGNLTEVLEKLSLLIRSRYQLRAKVKVLSADARMSAAILMAAPFALGALMQVLNPTFMTRLWTDPIGIAILQALGILMVIGFFMLRYITRIRV